MNRCVAAIVAGLLVSTGCSANPAPSTAPRSTLPVATPSAVPTATPTPPPVPTPTVSATTSGPGRVVEVGRMHARRAVHSATLLGDGTVLVAGGCTADSCEAGSDAATAERYDPRDRAFHAVAGTMAVPRLGQGAAILPDGRVLLLGGFVGRSVTPTTDIYDATAGTFSPGPTMVAGRGSPLVVALTDGRILVAGGWAGGAGQTSAEVFDPRSMAFTATGAMHVGHDGPVGTRLADGRVLVAGGDDGNRAVATAELFDPASGIWTETGAMTTPRVKHAAALLPDGRVLFLGGSDVRDGRGTERSAETYDPVTASFTPTGNMTVIRYKISDAVTVLADGRVLVAGGADLAEVFDPATGRFAVVDGHLGQPHAFATTTRLADGSVLITGGYDERIRPDARAWLYTSH